MGVASVVCLQRERVNHDGPLQHSRCSADGNFCLLSRFKRRFRPFRPEFHLFDGQGLVD